MKAHPPQSDNLAIEHAVSLLRTSEDNQKEVTHVDGQPVSGGRPTATGETVARRYGGMTRFKASNHPQQVAKRGPDDATDNRATPPEWFAEMHARFNFTLDVAASRENCKLPRYINREDDGLVQSWAGERVWCNPPYSNLVSWALKAWREFPQAPLIVLLVPANRTEQPWWHECVEPFRDRPGSPLRVEFIKHRRRFIAAGNAAVQANERPPFGVCLLIWEAVGPRLSCDAVDPVGRVSEDRTRAGVLF
jgi:phage N-6-adenine-methyltransferase